MKKYTLISHVDLMVICLALCYMFFFNYNAVAQVSLVKSIRVGTPLNAVNNKILFAGDSLNTQVYQLWVSDGTSAGTHFLKSFSSVSGSTGFMHQSEDIGDQHYEPAVFNNNLYFFAYTFSTNSNGSTYQGYDLWKSDGTFSGTIDLMQFQSEFGLGTGGFSHNRPSFCIMNNELYFAGGLDQNGVNLWKTDGTNVTKVANVAANGFDGWGPAYLTTYNNHVYFVANDFVSGPEVWQSDGTAAGTVLLKDIIPGTDGVTNRASLVTGLNPEFAISGGYLYFNGWRNNKFNFRNVYRTDGTAAGTIRLDTTIYAANPAYQPYEPYQADVNGTYFFRGFPNGLSTGTSGLFKSSGAVATTTEIITNNNLKTHGVFASFKNKLYFDGTQGTGSLQQDGLCVSDGTTAGTYMVFSFPYGNSDAITRDFVNGGTLLYFREQMKVSNTAQDWRMVETDGTAAGTAILYGVTAFSRVTLLNGEAYFWGQDTLNFPAPFNPTAPSVFGIYKFPTGGTLPVTLISFTASVINNKQVQLDWQTANELNNKGFYIEHSDQSLQFSSIQFTNASSNSSQKNSYSYLDKNPFDGINYYRLKQVDIDGKFTFSPVQKIQIENNNAVAISPNPVKDGKLTIYNHLHGNIVLHVADMKGGVLVKRTYAGNQDVIECDVQALPAGVYLLRLENNGSVISKKFIKE